MRNTVPRAFLLSCLVLLSTAGCKPPKHVIRWQPLPSQPLTFQVTVWEQMRGEAKPRVTSRAVAWSLKMECQMGQPRIEVAVNAVSQSGEWTVPWPTNCNTSTAEVDLEVRVNHWKCSQAIDRRYQLDFAPGQRLQPLVICEVPAAKLARQP